MQIKDHYLGRSQVLAHLFDKQVVALLPFLLFFSRCHAYESECHFDFQDDCSDTIHVIYRPMYSTKHNIYKLRNRVGYLFRQQNEQLNTSMFGVTLNFDGSVIGRPAKHIHLWSEMFMGRHSMWVKI